MRAFRHLIVLTLSLSMFIACIEAVAAEASWPMLQGNAEHNGYVTGTFHQQAFKQAWQVQIGSTNDSSGLYNFISQPIISNGDVYVSRNDAKNTALQAIKLSDGSTIWTDGDTKAQTSTPVLLGKELYVTRIFTPNRRPSGLFVYDQAKGGANFRVAISPYGRPLALSGVDNTLYYDDAKYTYAFNPGTFNFPWRSQLDNPYVVWSPSVSGDIEVVYCGGEMQVYSVKSGNLKFYILDPHPASGIYAEDFHSHAAVLRGEHAYAINNGYLTDYDLDSHSVKASVGPGYVGMPAVSSKQVYAAKSNQLVVYNRDDLYHALWSWSLASSDSMQGQFVVTSNLVFIASSRHVYAIDKTSHKMVWSKTASMAKISLAHGYLLIFENNGHLSAIKLS